jgi:ribosomal protein S18 acetylase RimI-like enzyme
MEPVLAVWRAARPEDDDAVVEMCLALNREDPGPAPVHAEQVRLTLRVLRVDPQRGRAVVLDAGGRCAGYALLISFWSNERGGEACEVDELYVEPALRNRGCGTDLFRGIEEGKLWDPRPVAIALKVMAGNARARRLYERLGFEETGTSMARVVVFGGARTLPQAPRKRKTMDSP